MSDKNLDTKGRLRSKTVGFRMSPEEADLLNQLVMVSGLNKQDYLINRALQKDVIVIGNPKLFIGLKRELKRLCEEFERLDSISDITDEQTAVIEQIITILNAM